MEEEESLGKRNILYNFQYISMKREYKYIEERAYLTPNTIKFIYIFPR